MKAQKIDSKRKAKQKKVFKFSFNIFLVLSVAAILSSCEDEYYYGRDGRPGEAYISLTWANEIPEYLDAGSGDIPPTFRWGEYYRAYPGFYMMYYEGTVWNGFGWTYYAYEVEYEVWRNSGEQGKPYGIDGRDGVDTYLTIECSPNGPFIFSTEKSLNITGKYEVIENTDEIVEVLQKGELFSMKITYRKVDHSKMK